MGAAAALHAFDTIGGWIRLSQRHNLLAGGSDQEKLAAYRGVSRARCKRRGPVASAGATRAVDWFGGLQ
jgi:hypothetical protein